MNKKLTKREIHEQALKEFIETTGARMVENGVPGWLVAELAETHAKETADAARPTPKQRAEIKQLIRDVKAGKPLEMPVRVGELRRDALHLGPPIADRVTAEPDGTFSAFVNLDGTMHRVGRAPARDTAVRIARVARAAARVIYKHTKGDPMPAEDYAATACVSADFPLGFKRRPGRPPSSKAAAGQFEAIEPIMSSWVVARVGDLLDKPAHVLPEGDLDRFHAELWSLAEKHKPLNEWTRQRVHAEAERWREELVAKYQKAGLLTPANRKAIDKRVKEYARSMSGHTQEEVNVINAEYDRRQHYESRANQKEMAKKALAKDIREAMKRYRLPS
jgi:hypothetical protein